MSDKKQKDFTTHWIFAYYEDGMAVSKIAHEVKLSEQQVYVRMRQHPETYEDIKKVREKMYRTRIRRIRGLSDTITEGYLDRMSDKITQTNSDEELDELLAFAKGHSPVCNTVCRPVPVTIECV